MFDTKIPLTAQQGIGYAGQAARVQKPYAVAGTGSAQKSRNAFADAAARRQSTTANQQLQEYANQYSSQAQAARAADVQSQRSNLVRQKGTSLEKETMQRQIAMTQAQKTADINTQISESQKDAQTRKSQAIFNMLIGSGLLTGPMGAGAGSYVAGKVGSSFTGGGGGMLSGLLSSAGPTIGPAISAAAMFA